MLVSPPPSPLSEQNEIHHTLSNAQLLIGRVSNTQNIIQSVICNGILYYDFFTIENWTVVLEVVDLLLIKPCTF